jgi:flagellar biosynthetic protein FlhB
MSDGSFQEKTEAPTHRKRQEARKEGQVPRSQELTTAIMLLAAAGTISVAGGALGVALADAFRGLMLMGTAMPSTIEGFDRLMSDVGGPVAAALIPVLGALTATAAIVAGIQARGILTAKPLQPKLERIAPHKNIKRLYGVKPWADLAKSLLKLGVIAAVLYPILSNALGEAGDLASKSPLALALQIKSQAVRLLMAAGLAYLIVALADYAYQIWQHEKQLKMSKEEVKREHKEQDGDPMLKARRRSMGRERARRRMFDKLPDADLVITNPTHIAVALRYRPEEVAAPVIVAMGERKVAERIKSIAQDLGLPVMENKPLARALLATGRVGEPIPTELYVAVAEVLAYVIRQRGSLGLDEVVA